MKWCVQNWKDSKIRGADSKYKRKLKISWIRKKNCGFSGKRILKMLQVQEQIMQVFKQRNRPCKQEVFNISRKLMDRRLAPELVQKHPISCCLLIRQLKNYLEPHIKTRSIRRYRQKLLPTQRQNWNKRIRFHTRIRRVTPLSVCVPNHKMMEL